MSKLTGLTRHLSIYSMVILVSVIFLFTNGCTCSKEKSTAVPPPENIGAEVFSICADTNQHYDPRIGGDFIVWEDERDGNGDVYCFNLSTKSEFPICTNEAEQEYVALSGNTVIWVDHRDGVYVYDIRGYDISAGKEFTVTTTRPPGGPWRGPTIDGNFIVWEDDLEGNWEKNGYDIRGYNINNGEQFIVCSNPSRQSCPVVSGDIVVWTDDRNGNGDIYGYNLSTGTEFPICTNEAYQGWPNISGNIVVWEDKRNGNSDVYGYNLSTETEFPVCTEPHEQVKPKASGDIVVWEDRRHSWWEKELDYWFYGYNLSTKTEFPIIRYDAIFGMGLQDFDGDIIVYYDMGGEGSWKIMGVRLP